MILASTKQSLQDQKTSGIVVNGENTHSSRKLVIWVVDSRLNRHRFKSQEARTWIWAVLDEIRRDPDEIKMK